MVSNATALKYSRIGALIDPDEHIGLGMYPVRGGTPKIGADNLQPNGLPAA